MLIRSVATTRTVDLCEWARKYHKYGPAQVPPPVRFGIALYQIGQGMEWMATESETEGYASACLHLFCVAEAMNVNVWAYLPEDLVELPTTFPGHKALLQAICKAQRMVHYGRTISKKTHRSSRYNPDLLARSLAATIRFLMMLITPERRRDAIREGAEIMTGDI